MQQHPHMFKNKLSILFVLLLLGGAVWVILGSGCYFLQENKRSVVAKGENSSAGSNLSDTRKSGIAGKNKDSAPGGRTVHAPNSRLLRLTCSGNGTWARLGFELSRMPDPGVSRQNSTLRIRFPGARLPNADTWEEKTAGLQMDLALQSVAHPLELRLDIPGLREYKSFVLPESEIYGPRFVLELRSRERNHDSEGETPLKWVDKRRYAYKIKKGEWLYDIFKRHQVSPAHRPKLLRRIREINPSLQDPNDLQTGQIVYFPAFFKQVFQVKITSVPNWDSFVPAAKYKVRPGEHLVEIMRKRIGLGYEQIYDEYIRLVRALNPSEGNLDRLEKGQEIVLPLPPQREMHKSNSHNDNSQAKNKEKHKFSADFFTAKNRKRCAPQTGQNNPSGQRSSKNNPGVFSRRARRLQEKLQRDPGNKLARLRLSRIYRQKGASEKAGSILEQGISMYPKQVEFRVRYARILIEQERFQAALQVLQMPSPPKLDQKQGYYALLAYTRRQLSQYRKAADLYRALTLNQPEQGKWWLGWGLCLQKQGRTDIAIKAYSRALRCSGMSRELKSFARQRRKNLASRQ